MAKSQKNTKKKRKGKITYVKITYLIERKGKRMHRGDFRSKNDLKSSLSMGESERKPREKMKFLSLKN